MKIIVSGGEGKFAKQLSKLSNHTMYCLSKIEMNVSNLEEVRTQIQRLEPDIFIHSGALTRPMIRHKEDPISSIRANILGTANVVMACIEYNVKIVYISTDYVYPGRRGSYCETDSLLPVNKYAWSKMGGECAVKLYDNHLIVRIAMSDFPFPHTKALTDVKKSLIFNSEAAKFVVAILAENGTVNIGGESQSIYDFAKKSNSCVEKITRKEVRDVAMAKDSTLDITKLKEILSDKTI